MLLAEVPSLHIFRPFSLAAGSIQGGQEWIALRLILLISSRRVVGRLGPFQAAGGGGRSTGKKGVCSRLAGALAEVARGTCEPRAARKSAPRPRACWYGGESRDGQTQALLRYSENHAVLPEPLVCAWGRAASGASVFPSVQWEE